MKIESCSTPKCRDLSQPGDDILVVLQQCLYAVFDGATDTSGVVQGESPGRMAARQAGMAMVRIKGSPLSVQGTSPPGLSASPFLRPHMPRALRLRGRT